MHLLRTRARSAAAGTLVTLLAAGALLATAAPAVAATTSVSFGANGGVQSWTVPDGVQRIAVEISGAQGGAAYGGGGAGARLTGTLPVTPGQTLSILLGTVGGSGVQFPRGAGGGGGSFLYTSATQAGLLAAAGGGGGAPSNDGAIGGSTTTSGYAGANNPGSGGTGGGGGGAGTASGGGGLLGNGASAPFTSRGGRALVNGGGGGGNGGFGGGGGSQGYSGGGGGGYSGGGGGSYVNGNGGAGGGGGSFLAGTLTAANVDHGGNGALTISWAPVVAAVSPASIERETTPTVTITGSLFTGATSVLFGTTPATSFTVVSDTTITAVVPSTLAFGTVDTTVSTAAATSATSSGDRLTVLYPTIAVAPASLPSGRQAVAYAQQLAASGGAAPYTYAVTSGALPAGLTLSASGVLSGTPTGSSISTFAVTAADRHGAVGAQNYTVDIVPPVPTVTAVSPASGTVYGGTSVTITGTDFTRVAGVSFGATPAPSFTVQSATSIVAVSPARSTTGIVDVTVTTAGGTTATRAVDGYTYAPPVITVTPTTLPEGKQGVAYAQTLTASGSQGTGYTYALVSGALPTGLTLASNGTVSGTPTARGSFSFTARATSSDGYSGTAAISLVVASGAPTITAVTPATGVAGDPVTVTGTDLTGASVTIGGRPAVVDATATNSDTSLTVIVPTPALVAAGPTVGVTATNTWGSATASNAFAYRAPALSLTAAFVVGDAALGAKAVIAASGFAEGQPVTAVVHSTPTTIYTGAIAADGRLNATVALPRLEQGSHELTVTAGDRTDSVWFAVSRAGTITAVSTTGSVIDPTATTATGLAQTGTDLGGGLLLAVGLLLAGLLARVALRIRRRRDAV